MENVLLLEQQKMKKKKCVVQSIEWKTFACLNNKNEKEKKMCCSIN